MAWGIQVGIIGMNETGCMGDFKSGEDYKLNASGVYRARLVALD